MKFRSFFFALSAACMAAFMAGVPASAQETNYDESKVPAYVLPDPLVMNNGKTVKSARQWTRKRAPEIVETFADQMYGHIPARPEGLHFKVLSRETVYGGAAERKVVRAFLDKGEEHWFDILLHIPLGAAKPVPAFAGINFYGNELTYNGRSESSWEYEFVVKSGFCVATAWRDEIEPDDPKNTEKGVRSWYNKGGDWGAISAWAWALSRIMDYLETDPAVDASKVAVIGHSRLGKTAMWAGANDKRFAMMVSNDSGCCGAAISRRAFGETFQVIATNFPHWFCPDFQKYKGHEADFPGDQNCLAATFAPRPFYVASATEDQWADPKGEWTCAKSLTPVYALFGKKGLALDTMPAPDTPDMSGSVGYHIRTGGHAITKYDWGNYIAFAKRHLVK